MPEAEKWRTRSGSHRLSATPNSLSVAVPHTTKSLAKLMQPITSVEQMKGLFAFFDRPTIIGSMKYGLDLQSGQYVCPMEYVRLIRSQWAL